MNSSRSNLSPSKLAWKKLIDNKTALLGLGIIFSFFLIAILGPLIRLDDSPKANEQHLELSRKKPGFEITFLKIPRKSASENSVSFIQKWLFGVPAMHNFIPVHEIEVNGDILIAEKYTGNQPNDGKLLKYHQSELGIKDLSEEIMTQQLVEKRTYWLGTDRYGRDMLSRLMAGTWISFTVGFIAILISLLIGISLGAIAGYFKGKVDDFLMWFINVVWSIPTLLLVIAITLALGKGFWQVFVAVGLTMWVEVARVVRGQVISLREMEFVEAGKALGYRNYKVIWQHILPNTVGPVIVISAANFAAAILIEAGLSFLGLGAQPPQATWGKMISEHKGYIITGDAYLAIFPGIAIFLLVLSFVLLGNGLRDAFDTKRTVSV